MKDTSIEQLISPEIHKTAPPSPWEASKSLREQANCNKIVTNRLNTIDTWVTRAIKVLFIIIGVGVLVLLHVHGVI